MPRYDEPCGRAGAMAGRRRLLLWKLLLEGVEGERNSRQASNGAENGSALLEKGGPGDMQAYGCEQMGGHTGGMCQCERGQFSLGRLGLACPLLAAAALCTL